MINYFLISASLAMCFFGFGCGGSSNGLSKAEFIKRADAICGKMDNTQVGEAFAYARAHKKTLQDLSSDAAREQVYLAVLLPSVLEEAKDIEALGAPDGEAEEVNAIITEIERAVKEGEKDPGEIDSPSGPFAPVNKLTKEYGFKTCSEIL